MGIVTTIKDANFMSQKIMEYDGFGQMDASDKEFQTIIMKEGMWKLDGLEDLVKKLGQEYKNERNEAELSSDVGADEVSRVCVILDMLEKINTLAAEMLQIAVKSM